MSDDRTRKAKFLSWATELELGTKSEMTDDELIERIMEYQLGVTNVFFQSSNVNGAKTLKESLHKSGVVGDARKAVLLEQPTQQYPKRPGLREIKQVELWKKYRPLVPEEYREECCPMLTKEILDGEKNRKNLKSKQKRDAKYKTPPAKPKPTNYEKTTPNE